MIMRLADESTKSALTLLPIVAMISAISYDVGYFLGIDLYYFSFFSLAEHIVFSLQAISIVILLVLVAGAVAFAVVHLRRLSKAAAWILDRFSFFSYSS